MIRILTLMDNQLSVNQNLTACHGLSFYIHQNKTHLLFDFGSGPETWENGRKLNVPFSHIQYAVFSHSHYDHSRGFLWASKYGLNAAAVYGKKEFFFEEKYTIKGEGPIYTYTGCGFTSEYVQANTWQQLECKELLKLAEGCWAVGNFERHCSWEKIPSKYKKETKAGMVSDLFQDEISLVLEKETKDGLILIAGCSHPGIINMVETVNKRLGKPVQAIVGGIHLSKAEEDRIQRTVSALKQLGVKMTTFNHCSGARLHQALDSQGIKNGYLGVGDCLYFG